MSTTESAGAMVPPAAVIVLAAGKGTRMKSKTPKILHEICGRSMVEHSLAAARSLAPQRLAVVVRHDRDRAHDRLYRVPSRVLWALVRLRGLLPISS